MLSRYKDIVPSPGFWEDFMKTFILTSVTFGVVIYISSLSSFFTSLRIMFLKILLSPDINISYYMAIAQ